MKDPLPNPTRLIEIKKQFLQFLANPVDNMRTLPRLSWPEMLLIQALLASITGFISGVVARSALLSLINLVFNPLIVLITTAVVSLIFFYLFLFVFKRMSEFKRIYEIVFFAHLPFLILLMINPIFPPIVLVGLGLTGLLLVVGFSHHVQLPKKKVFKVVLAIYFIVIIVWAYGLWERHQIQKRWSSLRCLEIGIDSYSNFCFISNSNTCVPKPTLPS